MFPVPGQPHHQKCSPMTKVQFKKLKGLCQPQLHNQSCALHCLLSKLFSFVAFLCSNSWCPSGNLRQNRDHLIQYGTHKHTTTFCLMHCCSSGEAKMKTQPEKRNRWSEGVRSDSIAWVSHLLRKSRGPCYHICAVTCWCWLMMLTTTVGDPSCFSNSDHCYSDRCQLECDIIPSPECWRLSQMERTADSNKRYELNLYLNTASFIRSLETRTMHAEGSVLFWSCRDVNLH